MDAFFLKLMAAAAVATGASACGQRGGTAAADDAGAVSDTLMMLVGSYADASTEGISLYAFNQDDAKAERLGGLSGISNPSFLTVGSGGAMIYAVGEDAGVTSTVNTIAFDRHNRAMTLVASDTTGGGAPCHINLASASGRDTHVITANYLGGSATIYALGPDGHPEGEPVVIRFSGSGADPERQDRPHAHFATFTPDSTRLLVTDLGTDRIHVLPVIGGRELVDAAAMTDVELAPGAGPRHIDWHPSLPVGYLIDEIDGNVNVIASDSLGVVQTIKADSVGAQGSGDIHVSPDGRFVYASNRLKADGIAIFAIDQATGRLTHAGYQPTGPHPRNFAITPNGRFMPVACRDTDTIEVYAVSGADGSLSRVAGADIHVSRPVCIKFIEQ